VRFPESLEHACDGGEDPELEIAACRTDTPRSYNLRLEDGEG